MFFSCTKNERALSDKTGRANKKRKNDSEVDDFGEYVDYEDVD